MDDDSHPKRGFSRGFRKIFGNGRILDTEDLTEEEIMSVVNEGHEQGLLEENEAEMINNIFAMGDKSAGDIMTHRKSFKAVESSITLKEMYDTARDTGCSRYPVYTEEIDNISGVIHIKDLLKHVQDNELMDTPVSMIDGLVRPVPFIPESRRIDVLFRNMQSQKNHMVIVVDEYGQTAGLVTMEDILEEIVGNIWDEHDEEEQTIIPDKNGGFIMDGQTEFDEVCELLGINKDSINDIEDIDDIDTLNGFLIASIDRIPSEGEVFSVSACGCRFDILKVENRMIRKVRVMRDPSLADLKEN